MSVPSAELTKLMAGGAKPGGPAPDALSAPGGNQPPAGGPMTTPQPKEGLKQAALVNISMVLQLLEQTLPNLGSATEEGKSVLNALKTLTNTFGKSRSEGEKMIPAELMQLMQGMKGGPAQQAMAGAPAGAPAIPPGAAAPAPQGAPA